MSAVMDWCISASDPVTALLGEAPAPPPMPKIELCPDFNKTEKCMLCTELV